MILIPNFARIAGSGSPHTHSATQLCRPFRSSALPERVKWFCQPHVADVLSPPAPPPVPVFKQSCPKRALATTEDVSFWVTAMLKILCARTIVQTDKAPVADLSAAGSGRSERSHETKLHWLASTQPCQMPRRGRNAQVAHILGGAKIDRVRDEAELVPVEGQICRGRCWRQRNWLDPFGQPRPRYSRA